MPRYVKCAHLMPINIYTFVGEKFSRILKMRLIKRCIKCKNKLRERNE